MPDGASLEKREILTNLGAELRVVETKPYSDPGNYQHISRRLAEELKNKGEGSVIWANQFDNTSNYLFHAETTAKEIYNQLEGKVDGFTCAIGTGGTLAGTSVGLKDLDKDIKIACTDPQGARMYRYFKDSVLEVTGDPSETEGIGQYRVTKNVEASQVDMAYHVTDAEAFELLYKLIKTEGLFLGTSCGVNIAGAMKMAKDLGPGKNIVTILCDDAYKYFSKMFNKEFLLSKKLPMPDWFHS
jgi:cysteine synthase A